MNFKDFDFDDNEPVLISEWEKLSSLQQIGWRRRELAMMIRAKLIIGEFTANREYLITPSNMKKALQLRQKNIGSEEPFQLD